MTALLRRSTHKVRRMRCERNRTARHQAVGGDKGNRVRTVSTSLLARHASFTIKRFPRWGSRWISPKECGKCRLFSDTFFRRVCYLHPPTLARIIVLFSFAVPLSAEQGPGDLADAESKEVQTGSRSAAGWGGGGRGRGSQGVSARTEAEDEVRRRPAPGWGAHRPFLQILARRVEMLRALDPSRPPRRRTAAPRHLVMGAGPSVQPSWARTFTPAGLQKCERQQCVCPVSFGVLFPTAGC